MTAPRIHAVITNIPDKHFHQRTPIGRPRSYFYAQLSKEAQYGGEPWHNKFSKLEHDWTLNKHAARGVRQQIRNVKPLVLSWHLTLTRLLARKVRETTLNLYHFYTNPASQTPIANVSIITTFIIIRLLISNGLNGSKLYEFRNVMS